MTIEKRTNGKYRISEMYQGKRYRITVDHKPSKKEAAILIVELYNKPITSTSKSMTVDAAYQVYIDIKSNVLSPATIRGYETLHNSMPEDFKKMNVFDVSNITVQKVINDFSKTHAPKTTKNLHSLIYSILVNVRPDLVLNTTLPQSIRKNEYIPSNDDIENVLKMAKGTEYEIPLQLATFGVRRSEVLALTIKDLEGNKIRINKGTVRTKDNKWIVKKTPKTVESNRVVVVSDYVADLIRERGYIYKGYPEMIRKKLYQYQNALGIPNFSLHKMRHYFASVTHEMGFSDADIMQMGGWKTDHIMKSVYRHAQESSVSEAQQKYAERMNKIAVGE